MKTLSTFVLALMILTASEAQKKNIETASISIENLINFVVEEYPVVTDSIPIRNVTFLIQTHDANFSVEDKVVLKQAFRLLSNRLTSRDKISIVSYGKYNGVVLDWSEATQSKKTLYAIENTKSSIKFLVDDGIGIAYKNAKDKFTEKSENSVVMIRVPKTKVEIKKKELVAEETNSNNAAPVKSNLVVLTAIALLPELIKVIKD